MSEVRDLRSVLSAAEQAAAASDYASAETFLIEAAKLQEATLGPFHPDLANTLNNLGIVSEITDKPAEAEGYFRRACTIAAAALAPDHPFVATSRKNLEDFCLARGLPFDVPASAPAPAELDGASPPAAVPAAAVPLAAAAPEPDAPVRLPEVTARTPTDSPADRPLESISYEGTQQADIKRPSRPLVLAALVVTALIVALVVMTTRRSASVPADAPAAIARDRTPPAPVAPQPVPVAPQAEAPAPTAPTTPAAPASAPIEPPAPPAKETTRATRPAPSPLPVVVAAQICSDLQTRGAWRCVPASSPIPAGSLYFYSRLKSPANTKVQHRWYHGSRLRKSVVLSIGANTFDGYRTYSRQTVDSRDGADWRVELRSMDGALLQEERFSVR
jgi:hypothetical protein